MGTGLPAIGYRKPTEPIGITSVPNPTRRINIPRQPEFLGSVSGLPQELTNAKGQVERLSPVEPGVAHRLVAVVEVALADGLCPAQTLGHVVAGELDMDAAGPCAHLAMG